MSPLVVRGALALLVLGLPSLFAESASAQSDPGQRAMRRYACASCHQIEGVRMSAAQSCVGCHQRIIHARRSGLGRAPHVEHYVHAPDLRHVGSRLREDYLVRYVQDPHDVRPRLEETMPRLPVTDADARAIARFLRATAGAPEVPSSPAPSPANVARGRQVFGDAGCPVCHEMGNQDFGIHLPPEALAGLGQPAYEAPNLRYVRDRMEPDVALQWILDPRSLDPNTQMPHPELGAADALAIRDFLFLSDPGAPVAPTVSFSGAPPSQLNVAASPSDLSPLSRRVGYADVRHVFDSSCIHCHAHTDGRSASAFGFRPSSLDLSSPEGVRAGLLLPDGSHRSILEPDETGLAPLLYRLMRRHDEAARDITTPRRDPMSPVVRPRPDEPPGMPLGLPPIDRNDLRLLATWVAAGAPD